MERVALIALVRATGCAVEKGAYVFLCDPRWGVAELTQFAEITRGLGESVEPLMERGWLCVPSGGTGGGLKFARHDEQTLGAAARGFAEHFKLSTVNALDVLPAHHVSGLMARVRCAETGGRHVKAEWKEIEAGRYPELADVAGGWVLSLVPTQLQRLLSAGAAQWLRAFRILFVGGGPVWPELLVQAAKERLPLALGYGMTETAAMVCASRPEEFLAGRVDCGVALPHVRLEIVDTETGRAVATGATGLVRIEAGSLFRGYFGRAEEAGSFLSEDVGSLDEAGRLTIHGRRDGVIISGGKKIFAAEVEARLREAGVFSDVAVVGCADAQWGQRVVACYPASDGVIAAERLAGALERLAAYQRPKEFLPVAHWPRNELGKLNRRALVEWAQGSRESRVQSRESDLRRDQRESRE